MTVTKTISGWVTWLKNWFYDKEEVDNLTPEYIIGTHGTTATPTWTGTSSKLTSLTTGTVIYYKMTSAGTSAGDTLNLTLADGSTTGAKNIYYNATTKLTTHFPINTVLCLVYDGTQWITTEIQNTNNYDRTVYSGQIVAGEALSNYNLVGGKTDGKYYKIKSGLTIDIRYPIYWMGASVSSGGTGYNIYSVYASTNLQNTVSGKTVTQYKRVYIKGTYENGLFTIHSDVFVSDDNLTTGYYYIPIGFSYSTYQIRFWNWDMNILYYDGTQLKPANTVSVSPTKTSGIEIGKITIDGDTTTLYQQDTTYTPASSTPLTLRGNTGTIGTSTNYAREDHRHPRFIKYTESNTSSGEYLNMFRISVGSWCNAPFVFRINLRGKTEDVLCKLRFTNVNTTTTLASVSSFYHTGADIDIYVYDNQNNTFDIITKETETYYTANVEFIDSMNLTITDLNSHISSSEFEELDLTKSTYIGYTLDEKTKLGNISVGTSSQFLKADGSIDSNSYLPLTGGTLTGSVYFDKNYVSTQEASGNLIYGGVSSTTSELTSFLPTLKSYIGTIRVNSTWQDVFSLRHRNGSGDGNLYGFYLRTPTTTTGDLVWRKQYRGSWESERTLLDSSNYDDYDYSSSIVFDSTAHTNIGSSAGDSQSTINSAIDSEINTLNTNKAEKTIVPNLEDITFVSKTSDSTGSIIIGYKS